MSMVVGQFLFLVIIFVFGVMFGFFIGVQFGGVGIDMVRLVRLFGVIGFLVMLMFFRYFYSGIGIFVVVEMVLVVGFVDKIDWKLGDFGL